MKAEIKDRLKLALDIREMKQSDLVAKTGIDKGQLSSWLSGKYKPRQNNISLLSDTLQVDEAWLMGYDVPMERNLNLSQSPLPISDKSPEEDVLKKELLEVATAYENADFDTKNNVRFILKLPLLESDFGVKGDLKTS